MTPENISNVLKILSVSDNPLEFLEIVAEELRNSQFYHNANWRKVLLDIFEKERLLSEQQSAIQTECTTSEEDKLLSATETGHSPENSICVPHTQAYYRRRSTFALCDTVVNCVDRSVIYTNSGLVNSFTTPKDESLESEPELVGFSPQCDRICDSILSDTTSPNDLSLLLEPECLGFSSEAERPTRVLGISNPNIFAETSLHVQANNSGSVTESPIMPLPKRNASSTGDFNNNISTPRAVAAGVKSVFTEEFICELESETKLKITRIIDRNKSINDFNNVSTLSSVNKLQSEQRSRRSNRSTSAKEGSGQVKYDVRNADKENKKFSQFADMTINRSRSFKTFKPKILFTKCDSAPYSSLIQLLGGQEVDSPLDCNILVSNKVHTTYKFLAAVALGAPIISENWLIEMNKTGTFIPFHQFALCDFESETRYKFVLSEALAAARKKPLYLNYSILVTANTLPLPEELSTIIECAGGHLLLEEPKPGNKLLAISTEEDCREWPSIHKLFPGITIISTKGFMISIMKQRLSFSKLYVLE